MGATHPYEGPPYKHRGSMSTTPSCDDPPDKHEDSLVTNHFYGQTKDRLVNTHPNKDPPDIHGGSKHRVIVRECSQHAHSP